MGMVDGEWRIFAANLLANLAVAMGGYFLFGGWKLFTRGRTVEETAPADDNSNSPMELRIVLRSPSLLP